jgi:hypothetical protein
VKSSPLQAVARPADLIEIVTSQWHSDRAMKVSAPLTFAQIDARWPEALVVWDRDVATQGWTPVFRVYDDALHAGDVTCPGWVQHIELDRACHCVRWDGARWELETDFISRFRDMVESTIDIRQFMQQFTPDPPADPTDPPARPRRP